MKNYDDEYYKEEFEELIAEIKDLCNQITVNPSLYLKDENDTRTILIENVLTLIEIATDLDFLKDYDITCAILYILFDFDKDLTIAVYYNIIDITYLHGLILTDSNFLEIIVDEIIEKKNKQFSYSELFLLYKNYKETTTKIEAEVEEEIDIENKLAELAELAESEKADIKENKTLYESIQENIANTSVFNLSSKTQPTSVESPPQSITIYVKSLTNSKPKELKVSPNITISMLKTLINSTNPTSVNLKFDKQKMLDNYTLAQYRVQDKSTIQISMPKQNSYDPQLNFNEHLNEHLNANSLIKVGSAGGKRKTRRNKPKKTRKRFQKKSKKFQKKSRKA